MQSLIVILIVLAAATWLGLYAYRFFNPRQGRSCGGNCCDSAHEKPAAPASGQTVFFSADDLSRRLKARKS